MNNKKQNNEILDLLKGWKKRLSVGLSSRAMGQIVLIPHVPILGISSGLSVVCVILRAMGLLV